ncbi:MAG: hypothetical protein ACRD1Y_00620 [Terriglobales bacterium]
MLNRNLLTCSLSLMLLGPVALMAQTTPPPTLSPDVAAAMKVVPKPKSKAEVTALQNLQKMSKDASVTPTQMDAALTGFVTQFPNSEYLATVATWGLQFYQTPPHKDYEKSLLYGEQAIQHDPASLYALATVGDIIAAHAQPTDLDYSQRVSEATKDDNQAIAIATSGAATINGVAFPVTAKDTLQAVAYGSLALLASNAKQYPAAVADYQKAATLDAPRNASDYFYMARAQIAMKQYTAALASLDKALSAAPDNAAVQSAVSSNRKLIEQLQKSGQ